MQSRLIRIRLKFYWQTLVENEFSTLHVLSGLVIEPKKIISLLNFALVYAIIPTIAVNATRIPSKPGDFVGFGVVAAVVMAAGTVSRGVVVGSSNCSNRSRGGCYRDCCHRCRYGQLRSGDNRCYLRCRICHVSSVDNPRITDPD